MIIESAPNRSASGTRLWGRLWAHVLLSPSSHPIACGKQELRLPSGTGVTQLWGEWSCGGQSGREGPPALVVLRLLGARGRAELATGDPANRLSGVRSVTWTLNPPGFGGSDGQVTIADYLGGALEACDFLAARFPDARLWVYGKSIGATAAIFLAAHRSLSALVLKNVIDVRAITRRRLGRWVPRAIANAVSANVPAELHPASWGAQCRCPALFVISSSDQLSWPDSQEAVVAQYGGTASALRVHGVHDELALTDEDESRYGQRFAPCGTATSAQRNVNKIRAVQNPTHALASRRQVGRLRPLDQVS